MRISTHAKCLCLFVLSLLLSIGGYAQDKTVSGTVTDGENSDVLPGVNVLIKGTTQGTVTDMNGEYRLTVPSNDAVLVFTSIGYTSEEVIVGNQSTIDLTMVADVQSLSEIVVTGYSVDSRRETTGSVATVDAEDLQVIPSGNVEQQLQGRVSGVTVITNGQPGTSSIVRVRGFGALGGNEPLYVVDGVPTLDTEFLAPGDIESTTVLKDATSASIYGARAAGGVIVYTTKKGGRNQPLKVTYNGEIGVTDPGQGLDVLNPEEQAIWTWNAIRNGANNRGEAPNFTHPQYGTGAQPIIPDFLLVGPDAGVVGDINLEEQAALYNVDPRLGSVYQVIRANREGTDWYAATTRPGILHRHNLGLSGGGENNRYYIGLNMQEQEGIINHQIFKRYAFRANSEFDITDKIRVGENIQATYRSVNILFGGQGGRGSADDENVILTTSRMPPIIPIFDEFGGYAGTAAPGFNNPSNPVADLDGRRNNTNFLAGGFGNVYLEFEPIEDLVFRSSFGGRFDVINSESYTRREYENSENSSTFRYNRSTEYGLSWVFTNTVNYKKEFGDHGFDVLLGQEALKQGFVNGFNGSGIDPFSETPDFITLSTVEAQPGNGFKSNGVNFASYFGSLKYDFRDKYLLTAVVRYDGSSRFGSEERFGTFPAFSGAWRISSEGFMDGLTFIEDMKIRGGYGIIGNSNNVDPNNQFSLYATNLGQGSYDINGTNSSAQLGFYRNRIGNPFARWERAVTTNIGFDALLFDGKLDIIFDVWEKRTEDLLFEVPVTYQTGFRADAPSVNVGEMLNQGIDLRIVNKGTFGNGLGYEVTLNGGWLRNEIVALAPGIEELPNPTEYRGITPVINRLGRPLSNFFGFQVEGLFQDQNEVDNAPEQEGAAPGRFRFADLSGPDGVPDGVINQDDRTNLGDPIPDFTGGLTIKLTYKAFDLQTYIYGQYGNEIYNISKLFTDFYPLFPGAAISSRVKDTWTPQNTGAEIPIFEDVSNFSTNTQSNSFYVEDGSYLRMQNITLGYNLPTTILDRWGMEKLRVFASANNLFTITGYEGLDPQVGGGADTNFGIDRGNFPVTRQWVFGVNVAF